MHFNPRSLAGATMPKLLLFLVICNFNPRSLAGATNRFSFISSCSKFQSTLPRGSDLTSPRVRRLGCHFNPRSLAGATFDCFPFVDFLLISIHAPSRERHCIEWDIIPDAEISIHAPSRERLQIMTNVAEQVEFQSTLPRGSDVSVRQRFK